METIITVIVVIMVLAVLLLAVTVTMYVRVRGTMRGSTEKLAHEPVEVREPDLRVRDLPAEGAVIRSRKPLRRTAWGMLIGGLIGTALMLGAGSIVVLNAPPAGPNEEAIWTAGEAMSISRIPFSRNVGESTGTLCTVTPEGRSPETHRFSYGEPNTADFTGTATVTCDQQVALLTGTPRVIADYTRGPLITVPILVVFLGILAFFPRFTYAWASLSTPGRLAKRLLRVPPRH
jgi:hypothetical protein